jgi:TonB family protein
MILARNAKASSPAEQYILAVSDSTSNTHWRAFASAPQVDSLVAAFEFGAEHARTIQIVPDSTRAITEDDPSLESPVYPEFVPKLEYPRELRRHGRNGRVWLEYVVGANGRAEEGSFRALLSDDERFTRAAVQALYRAKFKPARSGGVPIRQRVFQVITFRVG